MKALPKMAEAASSVELRQAIEEHLGETRGHVHRLERVFGELGEDPETTTCEAMQGLINEGEKVIGDIEPSPLRDAGLISAANRVEHYEIAAYGSARTFAQTLGLKDAAALLEQTLGEEKNADHTLTRIAQSMVNHEALRTRVAR